MGFLLHRPSHLMAWRGAEVGGGGPHIHDDIGVCTIHVEGVFVHVNKADIWGGKPESTKNLRACGAQKKQKKISPAFGRHPSASGGYPD